MSIHEDIPLGGYFGLEHNSHEQWHKDLLPINLGRSGFEYILRANNYHKVYIPHFTCQAIIDTVQKVNCEYEFYNIDEQLEPALNLENLSEGNVFLYTNYFGVKDSFVNELSNSGLNLIIDNSQAFFNKVKDGINTFYSARKFFGVPDGAYVRSYGKLKFELEIDRSYDRFTHLLKRLDLGPEEAYSDFKAHEEMLGGEGMKGMSRITNKLLSAIDYLAVQTRRRQNFEFLHKRLQDKNKLTIEFNPGSVPMVYPYLVTDETLRQKMINQRVFVPTYWPNVLESCPKESIEYQLAKFVIPLPVDQRYGIENMERIVNIINA